MFYPPRSKLSYAQNPILPPQTSRGTRPIYQSGDALVGETIQFLVAGWYLAGV